MEAACRTRFARLSALVAIVGCGSTDPSLDAGEGECAQETRAMEYQPGLQVVSDDGLFTATLVESDPGPPLRTKNTLTLGIDYAAEAGTDGSAVTYEIVPYMPDHGHGSALPPEVSDNGDGTMDAAKVDLFMAGLWEIRVIATWPDPAATDDSTVEDRAVFAFCVE